jgi:hypothetical protein
LHREQIGGAWVYFGPPSSRFKVGEMAIRVGLAEPAVKLLQSLQQPEPGVIERLLHSFEDQIGATAESLRSFENVIVRGDGVIGMSVNRSSE